MRAATCLVFATGAAGTAAEVGAFFEPDQPFFQSQVEVSPPKPGERRAENFVVRGILLPQRSGHCVLFDQELLRVAAIWTVPPGEPLVTLKTMAQISYAFPRRKAAAEHPRPTGPILLATGMHRGVARNSEALFDDPRPMNAFVDAGRGPLPANLARFDGIELRGDRAVLCYTSDGVRIREWHDGAVNAAASEVRRHFEIEPHAEPLEFALGGLGDVTWSVGEAGSASGARAGEIHVVVRCDSSAVGLAERRGELIATLAPASERQRVSLAFAFGGREPRSPLPPTSEPAPAVSRGRRWPGYATAPATLAVLRQNGLVLDRIEVPDENPWRRRVRAADLAFLGPDRAAVVTYDGDVWFVDGFADPALGSLVWRRFASGLHEPLAIAAVGAEAVQVATKNGVVRLHDRDGDGEADWVENFNDHMLQSQSTRSFPLDMAVAADGTTYVSQGGIVSRSGIPSGGDGTAHAGGVLRIARDGRTSELFAAEMREPFVAVDPKSGTVTATDQQGHYVPSSVAYLVRQGDRFGYLQPDPERLTPALAWLPHDQDISSSSQLWIRGGGMGSWDSKLLHLSYGNGRLFILSPDLAAPTPQAAVIPLDLKTDLPLLHARMHPRGDAVFVAGFQIWGTRTTSRSALGRLRLGSTPIVTAIAARAVAQGLILDFATPLDSDALGPQRVSVRAWNYKRSSAYGSGRYALDGSPGATAWGVAQTVLSADGKSVFVHVPKLSAAHQVELRHEFQLLGGAPARGTVYFTIHEAVRGELEQLGFAEVDLSREAAVVAQAQEPAATVAGGRAIAENLGCLACHSVDGTSEGKVGPTWKGLFGARRRFVDGTSEVADELYLRQKILDPQQKKLRADPIEMPSYRGVMSEQQLDAVVLYIRSLGMRLDP